jgi:hypothetical protein
VFDILTPLLAFIPLSSLLDGAIPVVGVLIAGAVVRQITKRREKKKGIDKDSVTRLAAVEKKVDMISDGMFGVRTPFGWKAGFVEETRTALQHLVADSKTNGGSSSKDDLTAIRKAVTREDS